MEYRFVLDMHTHTVVSGHAYCTLREMARAAADKGLVALGITEHAPKMPGTCHIYYFENLKIVPREMYGVQLYLGSEVNILNDRGEVDLPEKLLREMDVVVASLHTNCCAPGSKKENTNAYLHAMENPYVNIIGHPDDGRYEVDYPELVRGAKACGKVLELNMHSMDPSSHRIHALENDREILELCMKYEVPVIADSDAHFDDYIGAFDKGRQILEQVSFPEELLLNRSLEAAAGYLNRRVTIHSHI